MLKCFALFLWKFWVSVIKKAYIRNMRMGNLGQVRKASIQILSLYIDEKYGDD